MLSLPLTENPAAIRCRDFSGARRRSRYIFPQCSVIQVVVPSGRNAAVRHGKLPAWSRIIAVRAVAEGALQRWRRTLPGGDRRVVDSAGQSAAIRFCRGIRRPVGRTMCFGNRCTGSIKRLLGGECARWCIIGAHRGGERCDTQCDAVEDEVGMLLHGKHSGMD